MFDFSMLESFMCENWYTAIMACGFVCAFLATAMPAPPEGSGPFYITLYNAVNLIACNFGKAKNAASSTVQSAESTAKKLIIPCFLVLTMASASGCALNTLSTEEQAQATMEEVTTLWFSLADSYNSVYELFPEKQETLASTVKPALEVARTSLVLARDAVLLWRQGLESENTLDLISTAQSDIAAAFNLLEEIKNE